MSSSRESEKIAPQLRLISKHIKDNGFIEHSVIKTLLLPDWERLVNLIKNVTSESKEQVQARLIHKNRVERIPILV